MLKFKCPACKVLQKVPDAVKGRKFICPACKAKVRHIQDDWFEALDTGTLRRKVGTRRKKR